MPKRKCWFFLAFLWFLLLPNLAEAQIAASAILTPPQTEEFPKISAYLEVYDGEGNFVHDLRKDNVGVIEDGQAVPVGNLSELESGVQFVTAINLGPTFGIRDSNGNSRFDFLRQALDAWAENHTAPLDDLSFLTNDGPDHLHLPDADQWLTGLSDYQTDPRSATPSLDVLLRAINAAADPSPRVGMGRAVLLLTPPPDRAGTAAIQSLIALANEERVKVFVWLVSSPAYFTSEGGQQLSELADRTGGQIFTYSGEEEIPNIENYLSNLRYIYSFSYQSQIRNNQPHQISASIQNGDLAITSDVQEFDLQVLPPNPIFVSPPLQIFRANRAALEDAFTQESDYAPKKQSIQILVEFPDGRTRSLVRTTLYVDGQIADENTTAPFDQFTWDLSDFTASGTHALQVEALDSYGLSNISIETPVQITIQQTPQSIVATIAQNGPLIAGLTVALAGGVLLLVLVVGGRIRPRYFGRQRGDDKTNGKDRKEKKSDPVTQPVQVAPLSKRGTLKTWRNRFSRAQGQATLPINPIAYLEPLAQANGNPAEIPITNIEMTIGKNPTLATLAFKDPSVEDLHARIRTDSDGDLFLTDEGSIAGTWVNFTPLLSGGKKLAHGDIIHIGRVGLRFKISNRKQIPKLIILDQEPLS